MIYFGDIKPNGWLKKEIEKNMEGCIGHLNELVPELIEEHKIYGKDRICPTSKQVELGRNDCNHYNVIHNDSQFYWWNSETQSNWRDGFCRSAFLLEDEKWIAEVEKYVQEMLETQDEDGYLGIYNEELRFRCTGENGELWAQSTLFRALLGCYEATKQQKILECLIKAADRIMKGYDMETSHPFDVTDSNSGHSHGLTVVDAFYRLYKLTGNIKYRDYAVWLYEDFSRFAVCEEDIQINNVRNPLYTFHCHGVHTYEHIRALIIAASSNKDYQKDLEVLMTKLPYYLTPSGGPIGDEWVFHRTADASKTGYEYCSVHELLDSYLLLMDETRKLRWADLAEWLFYNASFGMRHPKESSITYCMTDNCYEVNERKTPDSSGWNPRYKFSPTHQEAAVCCVPNSGRIIPYFVQSMIIETEGGWKAGLYGPCIFKGMFGTVPVTITENTSYPFSLNVDMKIEAAEPVEFSLYLRFPGWADSMTVNGIVYKKNDVQNQEIEIRRMWEKEQQISVTFKTTIKASTDFNKDYYISYGPLLYALPIESEELVVRNFPLAPFADKGYVPITRDTETLEISEMDLEKFYLETSSEPQNFADLKIHGFFYEKEKQIEKEMIPMGETILRKVTFARKWSERQ